MSFRSLLVQTATVITPGTTTDDYGNAVLDFTVAAGVDYPCRLEPLSTLGGPEELLVNRETAISLHRLFLPPEAVITPTDRVEIEGVTYEVQGEPGKVLGRRDHHHWEAILERVQG